MLAVFSDLSQLLSEECLSLSAFRGVPIFSLSLYVSLQSTFPSPPLLLSCQRQECFQCELKPYCGEAKWGQKCCGSQAWHKSWAKLCLSCASKISISLRRAKPMWAFLDSYSLSEVELSLILHLFFATNHLESRRFRCVPAAPVVLLGVFGPFQGKKK